MASAAAPASVSAGWNPASKMNDKNQSVIEIDSNDENDTNNDDIGKEDDSIIDTEQLDEYRDMVERLGSFPVRMRSPRLGYRVLLILSCCFLAAPFPFSFSAGVHRIRSPSTACRWWPKTTPTR
jgi:hypothetical protein